MIDSIFKRVVVMATSIFLAASVHAAVLRLPEVTAVARTSAATVPAPASVSYNLSVTAGTSATQSATLVFLTPSGASKSVSAADPAGGVVSFVVGPDWQNGRYELSQISLSDVWGRSITYAAGGSVTASSPAPANYLSLLAAVPTRHTIDFPALWFTVAGGVATPQPPRVTALALTDGGTLAPGGTVHYPYAFTVGTSTVSRLQATFRYGSAATLSKIITIDALTTSGMIAFPVTADLLNGPVQLEELRLVDAQSRATVYSRLSTQVRDLNYAPAALTATSPHNLGALGFMIDGAATFFELPRVTLTSNVTGPVALGGTVRFTYAVTGGTVPAQSLSFVLTGPFGSFLTVLTGAADGTVDIPIRADWFNGTYNVASVSVLGVHGSTIGITSPPRASFVVTGAFAVPPLITQQPLAAQTIIEGQIVVLSVQAVAGGLPTYQWYRGLPGDIAAPIATGTSNVLNLSVTDTTTFWIRVTTEGLTVDSTGAVVNVIKKPVIVTQPGNQSVPVGGAATFSVVATSAAPPTYQWSIGNRSLPGDEFNRATITVTSLTAADAGLVRCVVSNAAGEALSATAILNIRVSAAPLTVTLDPRDAVTMAGTGPTVIFTAAATGNPPLLYQWQKDGADLPFATSTQLIIGTYGIPETAPGAYRLKVTNGAETAYSRAATLSLARAPVVSGLSGSGDPNGLVGNYVGFYPVVLGERPFTYQWRKNGQPIAGATMEHLQLGPLTLADAGNYDVIVTNSFGSATSTAAAVRVSEPVLPPEIVTGPASQSVVTGQRVTFTVVTQGSGLTFGWRKNGLFIPGAVSASYTIASVAASDAGVYDVFVNNTAGMRGTQSAILTVTPATVAPKITRSPVGQVLRAGATLILTAAADGAAPLQLQWLFNGVPVADGTNLLGSKTDALHVFNVSAAQAGAYAFRATNASGSATSENAIVALAARTDAARLINLSVRAGVSVEAGPLIVGFVLGGNGATGTTPLLVRGVGPALQNFGVGDPLPDPWLRIYLGATLWGENDDWLGYGVVSDTGTRVGAFPFASPASGDAAAVANFFASDFTAHIADSRSASGTALAEIYDATPSDAVTTLTPHLINLSARTRIRPGDPLIAGFVIRGTGRRTVLVRGVGPGLARFGVTDSVAAAQIAVFDDQQNRLAVNDGWRSDPALGAVFGRVGAFPLESTSADSALLISLPAGAYTAQVSGTNNTSGIALVEVYEVPDP